MKIHKSYIGKFAEIVWMDPTFQRLDTDKVLKGRAALSTWREYGVIKDITDGVVAIVHSAAIVAGNSGEIADEVAYTAIPEVLIEKLTLFQPETEPVKVDAS